MSFTLRALTDLTEDDVAALASVLIDCVAGGASVSFMHPLPDPKARAFWRGLAGDVRSGDRVLLVAEDAAGIFGTVQVVLSQPDNQPHRADIAKMLVHRRARRQGVGAALMQAAEDAARAAGKTLLVLDTFSAWAGNLSAPSPITRCIRMAGWAAPASITAGWRKWAAFTFWPPCSARCCMPAGTRR